MSMYCEVKTQFKDQEALVEALMETGKWRADQIEVYIYPKHLFGYHGDERPQVAHVIVRRAHVGRSSNDIGFERLPDGTFQAHISKFDHNKYGSNWVNTLKSNYAFHATSRQQTRLGRRLTRERLPDGRQLVRVIGYR